MQLKIPAGSITVAGPQCLIYYYHMSTVANKSVTVRKVESNEADDVIDLVTSVPNNAWTEKKVPFTAIASDYRVG